MEEYRSGRFLKKRAPFDYKRLAAFPKQPWETSGERLSLTLIERARLGVYVWRRRDWDLNYNVLLIIDLIRIYFNKVCIVLIAFLWAERINWARSVCGSVCILVRIFHDLHPPPHFHPHIRTESVLAKLTRNEELN